VLNLDTGYLAQECTREPSLTWRVATENTWNEGFWKDSTIFTFLVFPHEDTPLERSLGISTEADIDKAKLEQPFISTICSVFCTKFLSASIEPSDYVFRSDDTRRVTWPPWVSGRGGERVHNNISTCFVTGSGGSARMANGFGGQ